MKEDRFSKKTIDAAYALTIVGIIGLGAQLFFPDPAIPTTKSNITQAALITIFATLAASGLPVIFNLTSRALKIVDLIWVTSSAIATIILITKTMQPTTDHFYESIHNNANQAALITQRLSPIAYNKHCISNKNLNTEQCKTLEKIIMDTKYQSSDLESLCNFPIDLANPPTGYSSELIQTCINASYLKSANIEQLESDHELRDNIDKNSIIWALIMAYLVALRMMKSIAEVVWKI
jgi:hypothetical protein